MSRLIEIFKSARKAETYLYVDKAQGLSEVPEALLNQFGPAESVMSMMLDENRSLARADAGEVLSSIDQLGFYLQLPPADPQSSNTANQDD
ncbi:MAG: YcgL domain-containing protein [Pseudomonadota bacterium]